MKDNKEYEIVFVLSGKIPELTIKLYWMIKTTENYIKTANRRFFKKWSK